MNLGSATAFCPAAVVEVCFMLELLLLLLLLSSAKRP
jgi:hypothetical protein